MKKVILFLALLISINVFGQKYTYLNVNLFKYEKQTSAPFVYDNKIDGYFIKNLSYFDFVVIYLPNKISSGNILFWCQNASAMKWKDIYSDIIDIFGPETINKDYIPDRAKGDKEYQATLILLGEAKYVRGWSVIINNKKYSVGLTYTEKGIELFTGISQ